MAVSPSRAPHIWADSPLAMIPTPMYLSQKTDMWTEGASHMCNVHNSVFRGFNSIYLQAEHVQDQDKADFVGYCMTWYKFVSTHAMEEEEVLFPAVEKMLGEAVFQDTHKEHEAFLPPLTDFHTYLSTLSNPVDFSGPRLIEIMDRFRKPFEDHFRSEIDTIALLADHPNAPKENTPEGIKAAADLDRMGRNTVLRGGIVDVGLFFLLNLDREYEDGLWKDWPPVPRPIKWLLLNIGGWVHSGWWKFASCDAEGRPRQLYARAAGTASNLK